MSIPKVKKNDIVTAVSGAQEGKSGKVLHVYREKNRALVEGLNLVKKTLRKSQENPQGGIVEKEGSIALSNLMLYCPDCKKGVRVKRGQDGAKRIRKCAGCGHSFDG